MYIGADIVSRLYQKFPVLSECFTIQGKKPGKKRRVRYRGGNKAWQKGMRSQAASSQKGNKKMQGNKNAKGKSNYGKRNASTTPASRRQPGILGLPQCRSFLTSGAGQFMG